ncbi:MAG: efflux RND transporter permease subunit, partial [Gemmatimonadales bacterium]
MKFVATARHRAVGIFLLLAILAGAGAYEAASLPSSIFPSVTFPQIKVIADVGDEPAAQMMPTVTRVLEEAVLRVPGIILVRSTTSRGSSEMTAEFAWSTDMQAALTRVQAETQRIRPDLPAQARIEVEWMNTATFPIQGYALTSQTLTQAQLWDLVAAREGGIESTVGERGLALSGGQRQRLGIARALYADPLVLV